MKYLILLLTVGVSLLSPKGLMSQEQQLTREQLEQRLKELKAGIEQKEGDRDAAACVKKVFHQFCLGGYSKMLPEGGVKMEDDGHAYTIDGDNVLLRLVEDRVAVIIRGFKPGTWLNFSDLLQDLESTYGSGKNQSYYPDYADTPDAKETAVALGKGRALYLWDQGSWAVVLQWESKESVMLTYIHHALNDKKERKGRGL